MFRHQGKNRTFIHNLRLATLLSLVAGIVNITGVLALNTLTTNVTGHFAYFSEEIMRHEYATAVTYFVFTLFFLAGAFVSSFLSEWVGVKNPRLAHVLPIAIEILVLILVGIFGKEMSNFSAGKNLAFLLLFAMGIQNALVTKISQSTVRTTHLTGLFTDLGIELSQLFFYKKSDEVKRLRANIYLRFSIIGCFFLGCVSGGFLYKYIKIQTLFVAVLFLLIALLYDYIRMQVLNNKRKI